MFRRRRHNRLKTHDLRLHHGHMSPEASLAEAEAALRQQERKREAEAPLRTGLDRLIEENHLAELFRQALGRG